LAGKKRGILLKTVMCAPVEGRKTSKKIERKLGPFKRLEGKFFTKKHEKMAKGGKEGLKTSLNHGVRTTDPDGSGVAKKEDKPKAETGGKKTHKAQ